MSNVEILQKAIEKAIRNGWRPMIDGQFLGIDSNKLTGEWHLAHNPPWSNATDWALGQSVYSAIFNHDFAEALWGNECTPQEFRGKYENSLPWVWHLQQMVIADDPIKYLGKNITEG